MSTKPSKSEILAAACGLRTSLLLDLRGVPLHRQSAITAQLKQANMITDKAAAILDRVLETYDE